MTRKNSNDRCLEARGTRGVGMGVDMMGMTKVLKFTVAAWVHGIRKGCEKRSPCYTHNGTHDQVVQVTGRTIRGARGLKPKSSISTSGIVFPFHTPPSPFPPVPGTDTSTYLQYSMYRAPSSAAADPGGAEFLVRPSCASPSCPGTEYVLCFCALVRTSVFFFFFFYFLVLAFFFHVGNFLFSLNAAKEKNQKNKEMIFLYFFSRFLPLTYSCNVLYSMYTWQKKEERESK